MKTLRLSAIMALLAAFSATSQAQMSPYVSMPQQPIMQAAYQPAPQFAPGVGPYFQPIPQYAPGPGSLVQPASFQGDCTRGCCDTGCDSGCGLGSIFGGCCGSQGCGPGGCGIMGMGCGLGSKNGPHGSNGCCKPRWFDVSADWLFWKRDFDDTLLLSTFGVSGAQGNAIDIGDLEIEEVSGFRVSGAYLIAPATSLEASYFGGFSWQSAVTAQSNQNLFSVFSDFGNTPALGFSDTGQGNVHSLSFSSELDSGELNVRRRWVSSNCLIHSSWMIGARYVRAADDLIYNTQTNTGQMNYVLQTDNDLVGAQIGTDMLICISPRFKVGGEAKAGVYGSRSKQRTDATFDAPGFLSELDTDTNVAFVGEAGLHGVFQVSPRVAVKAGYQVLFLSGVAVASDNFNTAPPFSARSSFLNNDADLLYHGATLGFEFVW